MRVHRLPHALPLTTKNTSTKRRQIRASQITWPTNLTSTCRTGPSSTNLMRHCHARNLTTPCHRTECSSSRRRDAVSSRTSSWTSRPARSANSSSRQITRVIIRGRSLEWLRPLISVTGSATRTTTLKRGSQCQGPPYTKWTIRSRYSVTACRRHPDLRTVATKVFPWTKLCKISPINQGE